MVRDQATLARGEPNRRHPHARTYTLAVGDDAWEVEVADERLAASAVVMLLTKVRQDLDSFAYREAFRDGIDFRWQPSAAFWTSFSILRMPFINHQGVLGGSVDVPLETWT